MSAPIRWIVCALSVVALGVAVYLTVHSFGQTPLAGCAGDDAGCDEVLSSAWSHWLGMHVAYFGLVTYATLTCLALLLGVGPPRVDRWIATLLVLVSIVAAGAGVWFIVLQLTAIGAICPYCMAVHACGITIAGLVIWSLARQPAEPLDASAGMAALQSALPMVPGATRRPAPRAARARPALSWASGGAAIVLALLVGGQLLFPTPTTNVQTVALDEPMDMTGNATTDNSASSGATDEPPGDFDELVASDAARISPPHVVQRIPAEEPPNDERTVSFEDEFFGSVDIDEPAAEEVATTEAPPVEQPAEESADPPAEPADEPPAKRERLIKLLGGTLTVNTYDHPILGSPEAPHVIVELVSYDCIHCRELHRHVHRGQRRYGDQLAIVVMVVPLESACNRHVSGQYSNRGACATARLALGIAQLDARKFPGFHDWLMADKDKPPALERSITKAYSTTDRDALRRLVRSGELDPKIEQYVELFARLRARYGRERASFGLPVQILGDEVLSGKPKDADELYENWEKHLGLTAR